MPTVNMKDMLSHAYRHKYAIGAFDVVSLDFVTGVMAAAENSRSPVILSVAESHFDFFDFELLMASVEAAAKRATVPVAIHLDHGESIETAITSIRLGCNGVMVDGSRHNFDENARLTKAVVDMAHGCGIPVEGELGYVPGVEGEDAERHPGEMVYTSVAEAKDYVQKTGVDFLAVSIGTVHGRMKEEPRLDYERLQHINEAVGIPLVLHGGTGLADDQYAHLIENGIAKINYYTAIADAAGNCIAHNCSDGALGYTSLIQGADKAVWEEAERCMCLWGAAGRAEDVLLESKPWKPVEHVIVYNSSNPNEEVVKTIMNEGQRVLSTIPGVRDVFTGTAIQDGAKYRYTWLVRFCHSTVIESYRDHPDHLSFADNHFRPIASDRVSIDFQ